MASSLNPTQKEIPRWPAPRLWATSMASARRDLGGGATGLGGEVHEFGFAPKLFGPLSYGPVSVEFVLGVGSAGVEGRGGIVARRASLARRQTVGAALL